MSKPNFFIIGAPKCGTTSIAAWLSAHPSIFMATPKEPHYFSSDIPVCAAIRDASAYEQLFQAATHQHIAVGEASTTYLRSRVAVSSILQCTPEAKFVVCLRNPVEMVASAHMQLVKGGRESEYSLSRAWALQHARRQGKSLPVGEHAEAFQYGPLCLLGEQLERVYQFVEPCRVHVLFLEDVKVNASREYRKLLNFLGVHDDGRTSFPPMNPREAPRIRSLVRAIRFLSLVKHNLGLHAKTGLGDMFHRANRRSDPPSVSDPALNRELRAYFAADIKKLSALTSRDLTNWIL